MNGEVKKEKVDSSNLDDDVNACFKNFDTHAFSEKIDYTEFNRAEMANYLRSSANADESIPVDSAEGVKPPKVKPCVVKQKEAVAFRDTSIDVWVDYSEDFSDANLDIAQSWFSGAEDFVNAIRPASIVRKDPCRAMIKVSKNMDSPDFSIDDETYYTEFILQSVTESHSEAYQVIETLGKDIFYAIGDKPTVATISGVLLDGKYSSWKQMFEEYYLTKMRASKCAENNSRVYISYAGIIIEGMVLSINSASTSSSPNDSSFNMAFFVTNRKYINGYYNREP